MGIDTDRFVSTIPPDAYCVLCNEVLEDPIEIIECGHFLCLKCYEESGSKNLPCPFCGNVVPINGVRKSMLTWSLIKNMMVFCVNKESGCGSIFKYGDEELHLQECSFELTKQIESVTAETSSNCTTCGMSFKDSHDCINVLVERLKQQSIRISNLEMENKKIAYHLAMTKKILPDSDRCTLLPTALNKNKDMLSKLPSGQAETPRCDINANFEKVHISLERKDGSLGFNIIGGTSLKDAKQSCGIYVSRIAEGGAASQFGKLELNDRIIEVDGLDLRTATHAFAVQTFRNSGNPVEMTIERRIRKETCDTGTQTHGIEQNCSDDTKNTEKKSNWTVIHDFKEKELLNLASCEEALEVIKQLQNDIKDENKSELYDSAYDTLLTQRSTRSLRQLSCEESLIKERPLLHENDKVEDENISRTISQINDDKEKRLSTFFVIPGNSTPVSEQDGKVSWEDGSSEAEMEYEYEYEEVTLQKDNGKYGLLLCYGGDASDVAVYVGDMEENSVADTSGKIMVGDQIVQINGCQINNVDQAYQILHDNEEIILIVARAVYEVQSEFLEDQEETDLDCLDLIVEEGEPNFNDEANGPKFNRSLSSDISCSSNSISSNKEHAYSSSSSQLQTNLVRSSGSTSTYSNCLEEFKEDIFLDFSRERPSFSTGSHKNEKESVKKSIKNFVRNALGHTDKGGTLSIGKDSYDSSKSHRSGSNSSCSSTRKNSNSSNKSHDLDMLKIKMKEQKQLSKLKAYADSPSLNRQKLTNNIPHQPLQLKDSLINPIQSIQSLNSQPTPSLKSAMKNDVCDVEKAVKHVKIDPHSNWNETERRVWEEFKIIQSMEAKEKEQSDALKIEAEWRVRRSKDGKHIYIKKTNPSRNRVLKERERQLNLERCGVTTDDDAFTVYQGQYWNKGQRRKQLNRHNERRKRILQKAAQKALHENKTEKVFAEIVQRKMTLPGKVFDNFVTVEEILSQRNRSGILEGPVHVTTI